MAQFEEASPICRGKNLSWETILLFYNNMPREAMPKAQFNYYTEARINGWTQTHSQIARQLAFYYEENGICYPRFTKEVSYADLFKYMQNWAAKYFIPNPYAPSLKGQTPTCIYEFILEAIKTGKTNFDEILDSMFGFKLSSHDKVKVYLNNFTDLIIDGNSVSLNTRTFGMDTFLYPKKDCATDPKIYYDYFGTGAELVSPKKRLIGRDLCLQQIFYGAPGTGKSHKIKNDERVKVADEKNLVFRTTFHPDSDYSTFVGAYKPIKTKRAVRNVAGDIVKDTEKKDVFEDCITYSFVPQAFLQAYVAAWNHLDENVFLVIEEINRGNCAQIFGDLFQLLDRDDEGDSEYPIKADIDLVRYLEDGKDEDGQDVLINKDGIKDRKLKLPKNLYIWATMNTSDQSLFPIDSAFKRRWEWVYQPIDTAKETWYVKVGESYYSWTSFLNKVNDELLTEETAEDKHLGFYFCKATERKLGTEETPNVITAETFVGKVLFYLWNDVFKVYGIPSSIGSSKDWPYRKFYQTNGEVDLEKVAKLMAQLKIDADAQMEPQTEEE